MSNLKYRWAANSLLGSASALGLAAWPLVGAAQDVPDEVVVTGYRNSLNASAHLRF